VAPEPRFIGRYQVERLLGVGGMGEVYLARDPNIGRLVAIKVLRTDDDEYRHRFKIEIKAAGALQHRHIITIFDSGEHEGSPFLAMEYIAGETLADKIKRRADIPLADKLRYIEELCEGLAHAHRAGIVHRDIKPANVIVADDGDSVKVVDFGIARLGESRATQSGLLMGTYNYMSPEQMKGQRVDHRSDIFAVGLVLYELLSYRRAFPGSMGDGLMYRILHEEPEALTALLPGLPREVPAIVRRALCKEPGERYADIASMAASVKDASRRLTPEIERATMKAAAPGTAVEIGVGGASLVTNASPVTKSTAVSVEKAPPMLSASPGKRWSKALGGAALSIAIAVLLWRFDLTVPSLTPDSLRGGETDAASSPADPLGLPQWVDIPAGSFDMGCGLDWNCQADERPTHPVTVTKFRLMATEVTLGMFQAYGAATRRAVPTQFAGEDPGPPTSDMPVNSVTWGEAAGFCEWAGGRLPTEAEWEYAARAGISSRYLWGMRWDASRATGGPDAAGRSTGRAVNVGQPTHRNPWGLYDMLGNVCEWTSTAYRPYPYVSTDGREGPPSIFHGAASNLRVTRGGSAGLDPERFLRVSDRRPVAPDTRDEVTGFRCAQLGS